MSPLLKEIRLNPMLWLLAIMLVVVVAAKSNPEAHALLFVLSVLAIVPPAVPLSHATESVSAKRGDTTGGFLNAPVTDPGSMCMSTRYVCSPHAMHWVFAATLLATAPFAAPAVAADPAKLLRAVLTSAEMSFDPQFSGDAGSDGIIDHIYDSMLDYDYLARPVKLVPRTLAAMPIVEDSGATYVFKLKQGIFFTPDPAFKGKARELTAGDQAYALKRLLDPAVKSPWLWLIEGKIIGADEPRAKALKSGTFDYDAPIPGLEVVDRYTLRVRLKQPDLRFLYVFAVPNTAAVAREVVEAYGPDFGAHPVGTGPYMLGEYQRSAKIVLVANPGFRETMYAPAGAVPPEAMPIAAALKGRKLPLAGRIQITIIEEGQAVWLVFANRELDLLERLPSDFVEQALATARSGPTWWPRVSGTRCCCGRTRVGLTSTWRIRWSAAARRRRSRCAGRSAWATT